MRNSADASLNLTQTYQRVISSTMAVQRTDQLIQALDQVLVGLPSLSSQRSSSEDAADIRESGLG